MSLLSPRLWSPLALIAVSLAVFGVVQPPRSAAEAAGEGASSVVRTSAAPTTVEEIGECAAANAPEKSARQHFRLLVHDRGGGVQTLEATLHWKIDEKGLSKVLAELQAPPDLRGSSVLMIEREGGTDMFAYLPELKLVRRVTGRHSEGSVFGSDLSYRDMEQLYHIGQRATSKRLADEEFAGRPVYVLESRAAKDEDAVYHRGLARIDKETCVTLETVLYEAEDEVRKTLTAEVSTLAKQGDVWFPNRVRIEDRKTATHTVLEVDRIEFDVDVPDRLFSRSSLERRGR